MLQIEDQEFRFQADPKIMEWVVPLMKNAQTFGEAEKENELNEGDLLVMKIIG